MQYDAKTRIIYMDLVDLEHCGFNHDDFEFERRIAGIEDKEAEWPDTLIVRFKDGSINIKEAGHEGN